MCFKIFITIFISALIFAFLQRKNLKLYLEKTKIFFFRDTIGSKLIKINLDLFGLKEKFIGKTVI